MGMKYKDPNTGQLKELSLKAADTLPIGTIVDYDGENVPEGWEKYGTDDYSTEETFTGKHWIDGKPIYRKVINSTCPTKSATWVTISSNLNADEILSYTGYIEFSTSEHKLLALGTAQFTYFQLNKTSHEFQIATNDIGFFGKPIKVIIEYTKTTD